MSKRVNKYSELSGLHTKGRNINRDSSCEYKPSTNLTSSSHWVTGRGDCTTTCVHHPGSPAKDSLTHLPPKSAPLWPNTLHSHVHSLVYRFHQNLHVSLASASVSTVSEKKTIHSPCLKFPLKGALSQDASIMGRPRPSCNEVDNAHLEYSLRIQQVDVYDEGSYTCSIQTKQQPKTSQVYLIVQGVSYACKLKLNKSVKCKIKCK
ncbi:hypothetical protein JOQ06_007117 [Pogonophryne albipinna]|uniref:Uncharacterized protein n=1 Tax=Pogonophryne albipinna TaxID=1090488 RepID=A0AAD6AZC2_9TELE|nr:hypothetical protein JOQ06_007117 [Pogonophryne albipinna]